MNIGRISIRPSYISTIERQKNFKISGKIINLKQSITWKAPGSKLYLRQENENFRMVGYDYKGNRLPFNEDTYIFPLIDSNAENVIVPKKFICNSAYEWLLKIENRLALRTIKTDEDTFIDPNFMTLYAGVNSEDQKAYGLLVIAVNH